MKKIIYSLLLCFILLFTIPSVRADEEIIYKDGKELVVTNVKAMQPANQVIPDSVGYFEEVNAIRYNYVVGDTKYIVLKTNNYLPLDLYDSSCNLDPTMFGNVYVYNGFWAYEKNNKPLIKGSSLVSSNESNLFVHPTVNEFLFLESYLNNTFGFFILDPFNDSKVIYRFYNTYKYEDIYLIDHSMSFMISFDKNSSVLPINFKSVVAGEFYDVSSIVFYSTLYGKWNEIKNFENFNHNIFLYGELVSERFYYEDLFFTNFYDINLYFNIYDDVLCNELLKIDFISEIDIKYTYLYNGELKTDTNVLIPDEKLSLFKGFNDIIIGYSNWSSLIDCEIKNIDYFCFKDLYFRFKLFIDRKAVSVGDTLSLKNVEVIRLTYNYLGITFTNINPPQLININNNCETISIFSILKIIVFAIIIILFLYMIFKLIKFINKKNKKL